MTGRQEDVTATVARVLARLGAGQSLRLRRRGPDGTVEVLARPDGALEGPAAVLGAGGGPHVLFARHRAEELAGLLVAAIDDLELVTSSLVDGAGVERHLDGSGARSDRTVDGLLDRWDLPLIEQVRRYLAQRFDVSPSELLLSRSDRLFLPLGRLPHVVQTLDDPPRIRVAAPIVRGVPGSVQLDLALHRLDAGGELVRLHHRRDEVLAEVVLPAPTFMGQHLDLALREITRIGLDTADAIAAQFGGKATYRIRHRPQPSDVIDPEEEHR